MNHVALFIRHSHPVEASAAACSLAPAWAWAGSTSRAQSGWSEQGRIGSDPADQAFGSRNAPAQAPRVAFRDSNVIVGSDLCTATRLDWLPGSCGQPEQIAFYADLFKKVMATDDWKQFMEQGAFNHTFLSGEQHAKWVDAADKLHYGLMKEAGFLAPGR